ncbi:MAG: response regulator [Bryobacterales bacterium]|nr:response regulator [Bryobacterales bacterium]
MTPTPGRPETRSAEDALDTTLVDVSVLDDDADFRLYVEDLLRDEGLYNVRTFALPSELFVAAESRIPDIVLIDMKMGEFQGGEVIDELLVRWPNLCVVVITGFPSLEDMRSTFKKKVFDYLSKPFSLAELRAVLANAIEAFGLGRTQLDRLRERLGHRIKLLRTERDWSLKDLASITKLSVSQISSIERGAHLPSIESMLALCRAFGRKPSEIFANIDF